MDGKPVVGILALQGAFAKHEEMLGKLGVPTLQVRYSHELAHCDGLIIPGGESTTITRHILARGLVKPLLEFAKQYPIFGTCAGMIVMAREGTLPLLDITVERNAYGRQRDSFIAPLTIPSLSKTMKAFFIRAPRITAIHSPTVQILAEIYPNNLMNWNFGCAKTPGLIDRNPTLVDLSQLSDNPSKTRHQRLVEERCHISNIESVTINQSREFSRQPKSNSSDCLGIASEPVLIQQGGHLAASFHPELTNDGAIHQYFVDLCRKKPSLQQPSITTPTRFFQLT